MSLFDKLFNKKDEIFKVIPEINHKEPQPSLWNHVAKVVLLYWVNNRPLPTKYPNYFTETYGILDIQDAHKELIKQGYLKQTSEYQNYKSLIVPELKNKLKENNLKVTGEKNEIWFQKAQLKKSFKARTTGKLKRKAKKAVNPFYGKKGMGLINDPKKAMYNKVYSKTSKSVFDVWTSNTSPNYTSNNKKDDSKSSAYHKENNNYYVDQYYKYMNRIREFKKN